MKRYFKQIKNFDCAPICIINTGVWCGLNFSIKKDWKRLIDSMECNDYGTPQESISFHLKKEFKNLNIKFVKKPTYNSVLKHLNNGNAAIISFFYFEDYCLYEHIGLFTGIEKDGWIGHNVIHGLNTSTISFAEMEKIFYPILPYVWLLKKGNK